MKGRKNQKPLCDEGSLGKYTDEDLEYNILPVEEKITYQIFNLISFAYKIWNKDDQALRMHKLNTHTYIYIYIYIRKK